MMRYPKISNSELQIMGYVWDAGRGVTTAEIMQHLPKETAWSQKTVITFLHRLVEKGVLRAERQGRGYVYSACVSEAAYRSAETAAFVQNVYRGSALGLVSALCDSGEISREEIEELLRRLEQEP